MIALRCGAASISRRENPDSKSRAMPKPVKTPPKAADWSSTKTNWKAVYPAGKSKPGSPDSWDRPPTNAVKKKSGNAMDGMRMFGVVSALCVVRQPTASATERYACQVPRLTCGPSSPAARATRRPWR